ncbi:MAG: glycosyltransferase [Opitutaceae bacterium]
MAQPYYVLVTPVRNEERTIAETIRAVLAQTLLPAEWVIVSDGSTDRTDEIVREYAANHAFVRLLRREPASDRNFASVVHAIEAGIAYVRTGGFDYIGLLDADVRFRPSYFETLISHFENSLKLGLAGGLVLDVPMIERHHQRLQDVAGATQFFRRSCFESLGGLVAIREGGWDAITNFQTRANGYETRTFPDLIVEHLKPRNSAEGGLIRRKWQFGVRDYALGYDPLFEFAKCVARWRERPWLIGTLLRMAGFAWAGLNRRPRSLPPSLLTAIRREQRRRMLGMGAGRPRP